MEEDELRDRPLVRSMLLVKVISDAVRAFVKRCTLCVHVLRGLCH